MRRPDPLVSRRAELRLPSRPMLSHAADAVRAGSLVFVAGILPADADGVLVGADDVEAQARKVFDDLGLILGLAGGSCADVAKLNVYLTDVDDRPLVEPVREEAFGGARPASTLVEVTALAVPGARIEIDAVAVVA